MGEYDGYRYAKKKNLKGWKKGAAIVGGAHQLYLDDSKIPENWIEERPMVWR